MNITSSISNFMTKTRGGFGKYGQSFRTIQQSLSYNGPCCSMSTNVNVSQSKKERDIFQDTLPGILDTLVTSPKFAEVPEVSKWIRKVLEYNLSGGKKTRGLTTVIAYEMLEKPENISEESLRSARVMGWCVEMLQAYLLVLDDMMDKSSTRRGVPCWYRLPEVGLGAINDSLFIYTSIFHILKTQFGDRPNYVDIMEIFSETLMFTSMGQHLDYTMAHRTKNDYSLFTIDRYNAIVKYKTAFYTFRLPVALGLLLANRADKVTHEKAKEICLDIGQLFQIQDDYIDCYGDESVTGKAGTDIQEGKCSWLAVTALQRCTPAQKIVFQACYASPEPAHIERIKRLYDQLDLPELYRQEERAVYNSIVSRISDLSTQSLHPALFMKLLDMIYNRKN